MIRILVADDHAVVREGVKQIVADAPDIEVADEAASGQEVLDKVLIADYDVILLDITMPGKSGLDILGELKGQTPTMPVLVLSMHPEAQYAVRALKLGASGYLAKESVPDELLTAIRRVAQGGKYISQSLGEELASQLQSGEQKQPHQTLSDREYQVLCLIASGKSVKDIAQELFLGTKTISTYRSRLLRKMQMKNTAELIRYAIHNRLVD